MRGSSCTIENNVFDGNINNNSYSVVVSDFEGSTGTHTAAFRNNKIRNNYAPMGTCCKFTPALYTNPFMIIENNDFENNTVENTVYITLTGTSTNNFLQFKHNNFSNPLAHYELYNNVLYGSENIYVDSNYWGGASTQHIDSVIYDYFDDATKSVVYYSPVLNFPAQVDTFCVPLVNSAPEIIKEISSVFFPNPFTTHATLKFDKEIYNATFRLYNLYGQLVQEKNNISGNEIILTRENLSSGVYAYEVTEKGKKIVRGKAVIY